MKIFIYGKEKKFYGNQYVKVIPFLRKYVGIPFIALLILAQAQLLIAAWAIEAKNIVSEVWANMDNTAYERTLVVEGETPVKNVNKNGTIDFGKFQINSAWEAKAASMGMNIYLPEGNEAFAYWLFENQARRIGTALELLG